METRMSFSSGVRSLASFAALAALGAILAPAASAERIQLKNGHEIKECWILEETKSEIVVAVIRGGNIGKLTLDRETVDAIDRTRETTIEEALAKARKAMEEEARRRETERAAAAAAATATATARAAGAAGGAAGGAGKGTGDSGIAPGSKLANLIGPTTPEEEEKIAASIQGIGDTRNQGGAAGRRENALKELVAMGPKAMGAITKALSDDVAYRRMNAARAVAEIAKADGRIGIYEEAIPALLKILYDQQPWVRTHANKALEAVSGSTMGFPPEIRAEDLTPAELQAIDKWGKWWDAQKAILGAQ